MLSQRHNACMMRFSHKLINSQVLSCYMLSKYIYWHEIVLIDLYDLNIKIIGKELFKVLREKWGADFDFFISQKIVAVPGDVSYENLGVNEVTLMEQMCNEIQIIVNSAANTKFDERYATTY